MDNINGFFNNAELALAAYAELNFNEETGAQIDALKISGITDEQAIEFAIRYPEIVSQYSDLTSVFLATYSNSGNDNLFENHILEVAA